MKLSIACTLVLAAIFSSCSKNHIDKPVNNTLFHVSLSPVIKTANDVTPTQILGGKALLTFTSVKNDSLSISELKDTVVLSNALLSKQVSSGTYNITLQTISTAPVDTFIRFNAQVKDLAVHQDQTISLNANTSDGVITINKNAISTSIPPTFILSGSAQPFNLGSNGNYYYIYVKGSVTGKITFYDAANNVYMKYITVDAMTQYDILPNLQTGALAVSKHALHFIAKPL
ncbi:hypothetical protein [Mucilaginibacter aquaedulcis]|uniref:hypothetical protein n=1 Tax=Mucilaginibacter aquaedulcis TaxID=1187081 RepID=UPI0025B38A27|nr:hypothetical protein [Mucilaginibacter aquaedulcis]MDN3549293.1 hypothetical protein [Mucilaginibacter aquaedulcis]